VILCLGSIPKNSFGLAQIPNQPVFNYLTASFGTKRGPSVGRCKKSLERQNSFTQRRKVAKVGSGEQAMPSATRPKGTRQQRELGPRTSVAAAASNPVLFQSASVVVKHNPNYRLGFAVFMTAIICWATLPALTIGSSCLYTSVTCSPVRFPPAQTTTLAS